MPVKRFGSLKPKDEKETSTSIKDTTEEIFESVAIAVELPEKTIEPTGYVPGTVRLMMIFELLTDKSFPRRGPGKSKRPMILDAIIMAAIDKKLKIQGASK